MRPTARPASHRGGRAAAPEHEPRPAGASGADRRPPAPPRQPTGDRTAPAPRGERGRRQGPAAPHGDARGPSRQDGRTAGAAARVAPRLSGRRRRRGDGGRASGTSRRPTAALAARRRGTGRGARRAVGRLVLQRRGRAHRAGRDPLAAGQAPPPAARRPPRPAARFRRRAGESARGSRRPARRPPPVRWPPRARTPPRRAPAAPARGPAERRPWARYGPPVLAAGGAPEALAGQVAAVLGERAAEALREDPWQLLAVPGVRPEQADGFARALLGAGVRAGRRAAGGGTGRLAAGAGRGRRAHRAGGRRSCAPRSPSSPFPIRTRHCARHRRGRGAGLPGRRRDARRPPADRGETTSGRQGLRAEGAQAAEARRRAGRLPPPCCSALDRVRARRGEPRRPATRRRLVRDGGRGGPAAADWEGAAAAAPTASGRRADPRRRGPRPGRCTPAARRPEPSRRRWSPRPGAGPAGVRRGAHRGRPAAAGRGDTALPGGPAPGTAAAVARQRPGPRRRSPSPVCWPAGRARAGTRTAPWRSICWSCWTRRSWTWRRRRCWSSRCRTAPGWC